MKHYGRICACLGLLWLHLAFAVFGASTFTVATFNLETYLEEPAARRPAKTEISRAKIRESLQALGADVLALQEVGGTNALLELRAKLKADGLDYTHWELVTGFDTNLNIAVLSKFPIVARRPHSRENFLLRGRRFQVTRGFAEVDIRVNPHFTFSLITAHLKSRRPVATADETELREQEAMRLREIIEARLNAQPDLNLIVAGDFNDTQDSPTIKTVVGRNQTKLVDIRPTERNGDTPSKLNFLSHSIAWTHHYAKEDNFCRLDYLLATKTMAAKLDRTGTYVLALPNWGLASDHRPIIARFYGD